MPKVLPHVGVCMAVRFLRRVYSSDYIDLTFENSNGKVDSAYAYNR